MLKTLLLALALTGPPAIAAAAPVNSVLVRTITKGGVDIKYYRQNDTRSYLIGMTLCLQNLTASQKSMVWRKITPQWDLPDLVVEPQTRKCLGLPTHLRIEWNFVDGDTVRLGEAMSLGGFDRDVVFFEWHTTREERVRACERQRCNMLLDVGAHARDDLELMSQYGFATLLCVWMCEINN